MNGLQWGINIAFLSVTDVILLQHGSCYLKGTVSIFHTPSLWISKDNKHFSTWMHWKLHWKIIWQYCFEIGMAIIERALSQQCHFYLQVSTTPWKWLEQQYKKGVQYFASLGMPKSCSLPFRLCHLPGQEWHDRVMESSIQAKKQVCDMHKHMLHNTLNFPV